MISAGAVSKSVELGLKYSEEIKSSWTKLLKDTVNVDGRSQMNVLRTRGDGNTLCPPGALQKYVLPSCLESTALQTEEQELSAMSLHLKRH